MSFIMIRTSEIDFVMTRIIEIHGNYNIGT